jgi:hypothetical protein
MKQAAGLSKIGIIILDFVYRSLRDQPNRDTVVLHDSIISNAGITMHPKAFQRGMHDLLSKEFLYQSIVPSQFFINIEYMFNGDRLAFVKGYKLKDTPNKKLSKNEHS